jgi:hypothetical protein
MGPNSLTIDGTQFVKNNERANGNSYLAEYVPVGGSGSLSVIITHVTDKNEPSAIVSNLKGKKSVSIIDTESLKPDNSDMMVNFVIFDLPNLRVKNNLCRITKNPNQNGSIVIQYVDTKRLKSQSEGATPTDFTQIAESMKQLPATQYLSGMSERYMGGRSGGNVPWFKRANAWAGAPR